jgi:hypothetical protein
MKASNISIIAAVTALLLAVSGPAAAAAEGPYPVWWSPALELDSLDAIDARLGRELWTYYPEGMPLIKSDGDTLTEVQAVNCIDLERFVEEGYEGRGSHGFWLRQYQQAVCSAIALLKQAAPARESFLRDFRLDVETVNYLPAIVYLSPSCYPMCWDDAANELRVPLSRVHEILLVQIYSATEMKFWSFDWYVRLTILGFADFNRDGLEDMLVLSSGGSISGTGASARTYILTRNTPDAVLHGLNFDELSYWNCQCDEPFYDLPIPRGMNPDWVD